jgi:hypothetical protein
MQTARTLALRLLSAACLIAPIQTHAVVESQHEWEFRANGAVVGISGPLGGVATGRSLAESFDGARTTGTPGGLTMTALTRAVVDLDTRRFGVSAIGTAQNIPWSEALRQVPEVGDARVVAQVTLSDNVLLFSPTTPVGDLISFGIQPLLLNGDMEVPDPSLDRGTGTAQMILVMAIQQITPGAAPILLSTYEHTITGDPESFWTTAGMIALPDASFVKLPNGKFYKFGLTLRIAVDALANPGPQEAPFKAVAEGSFDHTVTWQGFTGFLDAAGRPLTDVQVVSESGFDWVSAVPEPQSWALMLMGVAGLLAGSRHQRRQNHPDCQPVLASGAAVRTHCGLA